MIAIASGELAIAAGELAVIPGELATADGVLAGEPTSAWAQLDAKNPLAFTHC